MRLLICFFAIVILCFSYACNKNPESCLTPHGLAYNCFTSSSQVKVRLNEYALFHINAIGSDGKIYYDSHLAGAPIRMQLINKDSLSWVDLFSVMHHGDSVIFRPTIAQYRKFFNHLDGHQGDPSASCTLAVYLIGSQPSEVAREQINGSLQDQLKEQALLFDSLAESQFVDAEKSDHFRIKYLKRSIENGNSKLKLPVRLSYKIILPEFNILVDSAQVLFDGTNPNLPPIFKEIIPLCKPSDKVKILADAQVGFGEQGVRRIDGTYLVAPYATILIEATFAD